MSEKKYQSRIMQQKHEQKIKKEKGIFLTFFLLIPVVCCVLLLVQMHGQNMQMNEIRMQLESLSLKVTEQELQLKEYQERVSELESSAAELLLSDELQSEEGLTDLEQQQAMWQSIEETEGLHKVYLTFDDGPSANTEEILDILDEYGVKATFFVVGKEGESAREAMQSIVERGHSIGLHSYSHKYSEIYNSVEDFAEDFGRLQDYVYEVTGQKSLFYRFPGGSSNTVSSIDMREFAKYLEEQGVVFYDWNISSGDGGSTLLDVDTLIENCTTGITNRGTSIVLMHDAADKSTTLEALPYIIESILAMEDTVILPITEYTKPIQHVDISDYEPGDAARETATQSSQESAAEAAQEAATQSSQEAATQVGQESAAEEVQDAAPENSQ